MRVAGIIAEYNPFHYGHYYQIQALRSRRQVDCLIILMSGNVVQRGEYAILDKWDRADLALTYGADLVLELPLLASLQSADYFAQVGVDLLKSLGCQVMAFGTESASYNDLIEYQAQLEELETEIDHAFRARMAEGYAYAAALAMAQEDLLPGEVNYSSPNHILARQYLRFNHASQPQMDVEVIPRLTVHSRGGLLSASQVRQAWWEGDLEAYQVPEACWNMLSLEKTQSWQDYYPYLRYQLATMPAERLKLVWGVREGLENRLLTVSKRTNNFESLVDQLTSKRWTRASIQRILLASLAGISQEEWEDYRQAYQARPLVRILGYNSVGQAYLNQYKQELPIELFSNYKQSYQDRYGLTVRMEEIMTLNPFRHFQDQVYQAYPIRKN